MRIAFVMPAYNEQELLAETVIEVVHLIDRLVIINDGSSDRTGEIAESLRDRFPQTVEVIHHPKNRGIGGAVVSGVRSLLKQSNIDAIGIIASDKQCDPALLPRFRAILDEIPQVDVAKGSRFLHPETLHQMPRFRYWGNRGVSFVMKLVLGYWGMSDVLHGYLLARVDVFRRMDLSRIADGYDLENTMMSEFRRLRCRFGLVPSPSHYGREKSKIVYRLQIPKTLRKMSLLLLHRLHSGAFVDRIAPLLMLAALSLSAGGAITLNPVLVAIGLGGGLLWLAAMRLTSPTVRVFPLRSPPG